MGVFGERVLGFERVDLGGDDRFDELGIDLRVFADVLLRVDCVGWRVLLGDLCAAHPRFLPARLNRLDKEEGLFAPVLGEERVCARFAKIKR